MIWIPTVDEIPMSVSCINQTIKGITFRDIGDATHALSKVQKGDKIGMRGPYGNGFTFKGKHPLFIGGGTGMSPVPMMDEMSTPTVFLETQVLKCANILKKKGRFVPDLLMAGGFISEAQIYKSIALSNFGNGPIVKAVLMLVHR
jgi:hypothetical protein